MGHMVQMGGNGAPHSMLLGAYGGQGMYQQPPPPPQQQPQPQAVVSTQQQQLSNCHFEHRIPANGLTTSANVAVTNCHFFTWLPFFFTDLHLSLATTIPVFSIIVEISRRRSSSQNG